MNRNNSDDPLVSVIVPVYNIEHFIGYCIKSILNQTFKNFELILIDDGSNDGSYNICKDASLVDMRIRLFKQENKGVSVARNIGIENANGKYLIFVDGDDVIAPFMIEKLVADIEMNNAILSCCGLKRIVDYDCEWIEEDVISNKLITSKEVIKDIFSRNFSISSCAKLFVAQNLENIRFIPNKYMNEDKYFLFEYLLKNQGVVSVIGTQYYGYLIRQSSVSNSKYDEKELDVLYFCTRMNDEIERTHPDLMQYAYLNKIISHLEVLKSIIRSRAYRKNKKIFNKIKQETLAIKCEKSVISQLHLLELSALKSGNFAYILCVNAYDILRKLMKRNPAI